MYGTGMNVNSCFTPRHHCARGPENVHAGAVQVIFNILFGQSNSYLTHISYGNFVLEEWSEYPAG
jgi:hypothetical protein